MAQLANCSRCGKVFAKQIREICKECYKMEEKDFQTVYAYLNTRKHREATLSEVAEKTDVDEDIIIKFIKEKRLRTSQFPKLTYPCSRCGQKTLNGNLCESCQEELQADLKRLNKETEQHKTADEANEAAVYFSINKK